MNGNIKAVDNDKNKNGKRYGFVAMNNKVILDILAKSPVAYGVYSFLRVQAGGEYNATAKNMARDLGYNHKSISKALDILQEEKLLRVEKMADLTGEKKVLTFDGSFVPNNTKVYTVYAVPYETVKETEPFADVDFTEDLQNLVVDDVMPFETNDYKSQAENEQVKYDAMAERIAHILEIGARFQVFGKKGDILIDRVKEFAKIHRRVATDRDIEYLAERLGAVSD